MNKLNKLFLITAFSSVFGIQTAQATSTFSANSFVTITVDSITNTINTGDYSGLDIYGLFEMADGMNAPGFGQDVTSDGNSYHTFAGGEIDSYMGPINAGDSFSQAFSSIGGVNYGSVDSYYQAFGGLEFVNNSSDAFTIEYSLSYNLNAFVAGEFATNTVALEYFNDLGDIDGYEEATASTQLDVIGQNFSTKSFSLDLGAFESDMFYADVSINGYAEAIAPAPVPVPAAGWLTLSGLVFLRNFRKLAG